MCKEHQQVRTGSKQRLQQYRQYNRSEVYTEETPPKPDPAIRENQHEKGRTRKKKGIPKRLICRLVLAQGSTANEGKRVSDALRRLAPLVEAD